MKIAILGRDGMLGHMLERYFKNSFHSVHGFGRESLNIVPSSFETIGGKLSLVLGFDYDYIINCIGAIKPSFDNSKDISTQLYINAIFPRQLAMWAKLVGAKKHEDGIERAKLIHITTDCVFDGLEDGKYIEEDRHNAIDDYGKSKSLGEPENCMVIRTSIIGPEKNTKKSLLEWIKSQEGNTINGFINHLWNGMTTLELSKCILKIIENGLFEDGMFHLYSNDVTKFELVAAIISSYKLDIRLREFEANTAINRTLRTCRRLNYELNIPSIDDMIEEMLLWETK